ncbi:hypothetical protein EHO60_05185 [Leptospira fletcheri]|uniref:Peptidase MA family protein n=1 Tax=Leptospira fletcheri TaxID=2484981 RepID=A0A4R9GG87_9LEPT|nr:hypothetical protein [Leptospira fletcheri]TGK11690.1 hypothetical protein EHO60_05185 [Leptospira fletcheri]
MIRKHLVGKRSAGFCGRFLIGVFLLFVSTVGNSQNLSKHSAKSGMEQSVRFRDGDTVFSIRNETSAHSWNQYAFEKTRDLIDAYESYTGVSFQRATVPVYKTLPESEKNRIRLVLKESVYLNGTRIGGYNNVSGGTGKELGIFLESGLVPIGSPALLLHELGHYYFTEPIWLTEGIVSFLPFLLAKKGILKLTKQEISSVSDEWQLSERPSKIDPPLAENFQSDDPRVGAWLYSKSVRLQGILYRELGNENYRKFLKTAISQDLSDGNGLLAVLRSIQPKNWESILKGWVLPGKYSAYSVHSFSKMKDWDSL